MQEKPRVTPAMPPPEEQGAIPLAPNVGVGREPEAWDQMEGGWPPVEGAASFGGPELWVRNVSQPSLTPFLPEASAPTGAAMVVVPGGAFMGLAIDREGYAVARWLNQRGIAAFVVKYRVAPLPADPQEAAVAFGKGIQAITQHRQSGCDLLIDPHLMELYQAMIAAREDALSAVRYVREHATRWHLARDRIGIVGFSAGATTALGVALHADPASRPDLVAPIYGFLPEMSPIPSTAAPAFIAVASDDTLATASQQIYSAWHSSGVPAEMHVFERGGHGFGALQQGKSSDQWLELFDRWLSVHWGRGDGVRP